MLNFVRHIQSFCIILLGVGMIPSFVGAADVFDEELENLLAKPTITKKTLPDGSVISTITIGSTANGTTSAGYVTLPSGENLKFTKTAGVTTFVNTSGGGTATCNGNSCSGDSFITQSVSSTMQEFNSASDASPIDIIVTEKVPGAECTCIADGALASEDAAGNYTAGVGEAACGTPETRKYKCSVSKGMTSFQNIIRDITKWFIYITMLLGVLALVGSGILWAWGSESEEYTKKAKGWAVNIIIGLALLFTFRYILGFLAPWIFV